MHKIKTEARVSQKDNERYDTMYKENDTMIPRDRISDDMLRRMLDGDAIRPMPNTQNTRPDGRKTWGLTGYPLASVYAPLQDFNALFDMEAALKSGTMFEELYLPFMGESIAHKGGMCRD